MGGACGTYGEERRGAYAVLVGTPKGKGPLVRSRLKWEDK
jgi:hypothetical protein